MSGETDEITRYGVHCDRCNRSVGDFEAGQSKMKAAISDAWGVPGYGCPWCSGGAMPDWENVAPLRCTCCHRPLLIDSPFKFHKDTP